MNSGRGDAAHIDEGTLMAWIDEELDEDRRAVVRAHLGACGMCAERHDALRFAERRVTVGLEEIDVPSPWSDVPDDLREAARRAVAEAGGAAGARRPGLRVSRRALAAAAGLTLVLAAGAYAIPGSPVRGWIDTSFDLVAGWVAPEGSPEPTPSSVSVEPAAEAVRVSLIDTAPGLRVIVSLSSGRAAEAVARDGRIRVGTGRIEVLDVPHGELRVGLPAGIGDAVLDVGG
ncbi:MAG: zf-HC2 domain-containing protein, partial [Gemmatimonadota bacterium]|nr:zf-HC2 domain-containing protein [Gemmatimonadota bacterium]